MLAMIAAAETAPNFLLRQRISAEQLRRVTNVCAVYEHEWRDADGVACFAFTVGGLLDGKPLGGIQGGATVGGEVIVIAGVTREEAMQIAADGLETTINGLDVEEERYVEAHAALARLSSVGPARRVELATADVADKSDEFEADAAAIRKLRGDDIVLTVGGIEN